MSSLTHLLLTDLTEGPIVWAGIALIAIYGFYLFKNKSQEEKDKRDEDSRKRDRE